MGSARRWCPRASRAGRGRTQVRVRVPVGRAALELRLLREARPDDARGRAGANPAARGDLPRGRGPAGAGAGPYLALGPLDPAAPRLRAVRQHPPRPADAGDQVAAGRPDAGRDRLHRRPREQRGRVFLDRRPQLRGDGRGGGDADQHLHPPRRRPDHALRLRAGRHPGQEARHLGHQVERRLHRHALLGRALQGDGGPLSRTSGPASTTSTS